MRQDANDVKTVESARLLSLMEPGDIILARERGLKHDIDRVFQRSWWNHVLLYIGNGKALDASPLKGCHIFNLEFRRERYEACKALRHAKLSKSERINLAEKALKEFIGKRFSWLPVVKILFFRNFKLKKWQKPLQYEKYECDAGNVICSTLISMSYSEKGVSVNNNYPPEYAVPKDFISPEGFRVVFDKRWA